MTRQENESEPPTKHQIRQAVAEVASKLDLEETSFKKIQRLVKNNDDWRLEQSCIISTLLCRCFAHHAHRLVAEKLGVTIEDLAPQKRFIKKCIEHETEKADGVAPTEKEIHKAAKNLALKVDTQTTTFEKFVKLLEDKMDCEDLAASKPMIRVVYEEGKELDAKIIKKVKTLAKLSSVDLKKISDHEFLNMMQERFHDIDLSPKEDLICKTFTEFKHKHLAESHYSAPRSNVSTSQGDERKHHARAHHSAPGPNTSTSQGERKHHAGARHSPSGSNASTSQGNERKHHARVHNSTPGSNISTSQGNSSTECDKADIDDAMAVSMRCGARDSPIKSGEGAVNNLKRSLDLEQGCKIPEAAGLNWVDNFFDNDTEDLVAVFDREFVT